MKTETVAKGVQGTIQRATLLPVRYGLSIDRVRRRLMNMAAMLGRWELTPTIPTTAVVLQRHPGIAPELRGVDVAIHGYRHVSYANLSPQKQAEDLDNAREVFTQYGFPVRGFRAPYLQSDAFTMQLLRARGFLFDSSFSRVVLSPRHPAYATSAFLSSMRYGAPALAEEGFPSDGRVVEIPVSLPDDEILVDGLGLHTPSTLWSVFQSMLNVVHASQSVLVLQIHPERFHICEEAVELLIEQASNLGAWKASLSEVAEWVLRRGGGPRGWPRGAPMAICVSGDLDAAALGDFASRFLGA